MVINLDNIKYIFQIPLQWYKRVHNACFKTYGEDFVKIDATDDGTNIISLDTERLDETIEEKIDEKISELGEVKSVDGHTPDENGDVSFGLDANKYVVTDADGHLSTSDALSAVQSIKIQGQTETFSPDSNGLATLTIKHSGISDWGDATGNFVTPQAVETQIQSHNFATQQGLNQLGTTVQGVIGRVDEHEGRIEALEDWQGEEVQKDTQRDQSLTELKTTVEGHTVELEDIEDRLGQAEQDISDLDVEVSQAYSPSNPPNTSDLADWDDISKDFCKYDNGGDTTTKGIAAFQNDTVSYLGRSDTKQTFITLKGKAVSTIAQNGIPYRTDGEDDIKWTPDFVKLAKDQTRCRLVGVNRLGNWSSLMNDSTLSQGIPYLGKDGGAGSTSSTLNVLNRTGTLGDAIVVFDKDGNITTKSWSAQNDGIICVDSEGELNMFTWPEDSAALLGWVDGGLTPITQVEGSLKKEFIFFYRGQIGMTENPLPFTSTGFIYNLNVGPQNTTQYIQWGTGENDVARGNHKHNADGTTASSSSVDVVSDITWNGTQLVIGHKRLNYSNGIFVGTTSLADTTINTVTYNPS